MPVLSVKKVAAAAGKDPKTLRLWCERGLVPGAERGGAGMRWRIRGKSAVAVAAEAHQRAKGFARRRLTKAESGLRKIERVTRKLNRQMKKLQPRPWTTRKGLAAVKYMSIVSAALLDKSKDELEMIGLNESAVRDLAWHLPLHGAGLRASMTGALCILMAESGDMTRTATARRAGVSRRAFGRVFGPYWDGARGLLAEMTEKAPDTITAWQAKGKDKRTGEMIAERVPIALPASATAQEIRAWKAGLRFADSDEDA
jgi:hypothetical protein